MIKNLLLLFIAILVAFILSEIFLRLLNMPKFYKGHSGTIQPYFYLNDDSTDYMYVNFPSSKVKFMYEENPRGYFDKENAVYHAINSSGFRGGPFVKEKEPNTFRIAFLGDSFTFGEGVKDDDTFAEKLKTLLKKKYNSINFESYNFGIPGYNTDQELLLLKNLVLESKPDAVVLTYNLNDVEPKSFYYDKKKKSFMHIPQGLKNNEIFPEFEPEVQSVLFKSNVLKFIWQLLNKKEITGKTTQYYLGMYKETNPAWAQRKKSLKEFIGVCRENKMDCYIMVFPLLFSLNEDYPFANLHAQVKQVVENESGGYATFIDLFPVFKGKKDVDLWVHLTDHHPNEVAHEMVAEHMAGIIKADSSRK